MKMVYCLSAYFLLILIITSCVDVEGEECNPMGEITGTNPPVGQCNPDKAKCCVEGENYPTYNCSPPVSSQTMATLTLNNFTEGGDGGAASECDTSYHSDNELVVALSTGWFDNQQRCNQSIIINGNGRTVTAKVVDQCSSTEGCDEDHGYQPPCAIDVVDASGSVWDALGLLDGDPNRGELTITWSDA